MHGSHAQMAKKTLWIVLEYLRNAWFSCGVFKVSPPFLVLEYLRNAWFSCESETVKHTSEF